jgi:hypothetical protein
MLKQQTFMSRMNVFADRLNEEFVNEGVQLKALSPVVRVRGVNCGLHEHASHPSINDLFFHEPQRLIHLPIQPVRREDDDDVNTPLVKRFLQLVEASSAGTLSSNGFVREY